MTTDSPAPGFAHALMVAAVLLTATARTAPDALAQQSDVSAPVGGFKPPGPAASSGAGSSGQAKGESKTHSTASIAVLGQKTFTLETVRFVEMTLEASVRTRFLIDAG